MLGNVLNLYFLSTINIRISEVSINRWLVILGSYYYVYINLYVFMKIVPMSLFHKTLHFYKCTLLIHFAFYENQGIKKSRERFSM